MAGHVADAERTEGEQRIDVDGATVTLLPRRAYDARYVPSHGVIGFAFESQAGTHAIGGDALQPFRTVPYTLSWLPPGCDVFSTSATGGEYLTVSLHPGALMGSLTDDVAGDVAGDVTGDLVADLAGDLPAQRLVERRDALARQAACRLRARLLSGQHDLDASRADIRRLCERLAGSAEDTGEQRVMASWLTASRQRRIDECIDARLGERLDVTHLAATCQVSTSFLTRIMKASFGRTPHDYLIERRLARARERLLHGTESIGEIALACGFSSHAHLSATLRQRLGVTPTMLRRHGGRAPRRG